MGRPDSSSAIQLRWGAMERARVASDAGSSSATSGLPTSRNRSPARRSISCSLMLSSTRPARGTKGKSPASSLGASGAITVRWIGRAPESGWPAYRARTTTRTTAA